MNNQTKTKEAMGISNNSLKQASKQTMEHTHNLILSNHLNHKTRSQKMGPLCVLIETRDEIIVACIIIMQ
jgi:hypothetical protein